MHTGIIIYRYVSHETILFIPMPNFNNKNNNVAMNVSTNSCYLALQLVTSAFTKLPIDKNLAYANV